MASTKLAATFKAHRVSICVVNFCHLMTAANRCIELGLQPIFSGNTRSGVFINVVVPFRDKELERPDSAIDVLREVLMDLNVRFDGKPTEVELICPPDYIPTKTVGTCSCCGKVLPVVPRHTWSSPDTPEFMVARHETVKKGISVHCNGSGILPVD